LDEFEQLNIQSAVQWTLSRTFKLENILSERFVLNLHSKMFEEVWRWSGEFRRSDKNIGVSYWLIRTEMLKLLDDAHFWIENEIFSPDEIAIRIKHRLVSIHCFPNGNGRHSRLFADVIISQVFKRPVFSWGGERADYIQSLKKADLGDYKPLILFARQPSRIG